MTDSLIVMLPIILFPTYLSRAFKDYREESLLITGFCVLTLISPLMAQLFFDQSYLTGILLVRSNFLWLSFFAYVLLIRNMAHVDKLLRFLTILVGIYICILILTYYIPSLGIIHYPKKFYNAESGMMRFGDYRMFFPYGNIAIMLYCVVLARILNTRQEGKIRRVFHYFFVIIVIFSVISTYTRAMIFSFFVATAFAFFTGERRYFKAAAVALLVLVISAEGFMAAGGDSILNKTKVGKMVSRYNELGSETGRSSQADMYIKQFLRSPLTGVGNLATQVDRPGEFDGTGAAATYRKYGFFNGSDWGYLKIAGESGVLGLAWVVWFYLYFFSKGRQIIKKARVLGNAPNAVAISRGLLSFMVYLMTTGITMAHFVIVRNITILPLSLVLMGVMWKTLNNRAVTSNEVANHPLLQEQTDSSNA
jgi:hypothetical protein